jgi:hypothetical protein
MSLKPWREIIVPHSDVLNGTIQQSEFAADLTAVRTGKASLEYGDAKAFYERTFITDGMGRLLTQVAQRLNGIGGEPIIQLQTAFGGGKTHTMLAVYHLASRKYSIKQLIGIPELLDKASLMDVPQSRVAVLDGTAHAPGQPWNYGKQSIKTLWGELAWQLGQADGYEMVKASDENGTSPGKEILCDLLNTYSPCVVLLDELVVYIRQFADSQVISGGTYDSNLSFIQSLTEAAKLVPNVVVIASLPESDNQAGGSRGIAVLKALEGIVSRVHALWKTVAPEEAFEIVRRRLFEPINDIKARDRVCRAFADTYFSEGNKVPQETQESRYFDRMVQSYPIHPEVFAQLYGEWTTIDGFQRTRGVLKLMAKTIFRLWQDDNKDLMILPGSLPLYDGGARNELTYYLEPGWDAVMYRDIDGERAETTLLETKETRFGSVQAARRVARTIFLSTAPSSVNAISRIRGIDRARILLGCLQPGQTSSLYSDALNRLSGQLHYMSFSGDKTTETTRYWFDTRANLRREMEERKQRFDDKSELRIRMADIIKKLNPGGSLFDGTHIFTPSSDVPDDGALRLVVLTPEEFYSKDEPRIAIEASIQWIRNNGTKPRYCGNRLLFLAPDHGALTRFRDCIRIALAWESIIDDVSSMRLVLDNIQTEQAKKEYKNAEEVLPRIARECFKWLLCPSQKNAIDTPTIETFPLNTSVALLSSEIERVCIDNELVITTWSPIHLRAELTKYYWKADNTSTKAEDFWEDTLRYIYLPRLKNRDVLTKVILIGSSAKDFFGTAYGIQDSKYQGFKYGDPNIQVDNTLLLIDPSVAQMYENLNRPVSTFVSLDSQAVNEPDHALSTLQTSTPNSNPTQKSVSFNTHADISPAVAKMKLAQISDEIISLLIKDPNAEIKVRIEIEAKFPNGVTNEIKRSINENCTVLGTKNINWE